MKKRKGIAIILALGVTAALSGCAGFDAGAYTQAVLDVSYKNQTENYIELTEATDGEAKSVFQKNLDATMAEFKTIQLPEELEKNYRELFETMIKQVKYTVGEAKKQKDKSYIVEVTVEPMTIFDDTYESFQKKAEEYAQGITDTVMKGAAMPADEEIENEVYRLYYEILKAELDAGVKYGPAESIRLRVIKQESGAYEIKQEDLKKLDGKLISQKMMEQEEKEE